MCICTVCKFETKMLIGHLYIISGRGGKQNPEETNINMEEKCTETSHIVT